MNDETKYKYELAKMYEFICRIDRICQRYNYDYLSVVSDELSYNAIAMCLVQLGERANHIKNTNIEKFKENPMNLQGVISMRNKVVHGYTGVNLDFFIDAIKNDVPFFKEYIEENVIQEVLKDPYCLYEEEYEEVLKRISKEQEMER